MKKKIFFSALTVALLLSLSACGGQGNNTPATDGKDITKTESSTDQVKTEDNNISQQHLDTYNFMLDKIYSSISDESNQNTSDQTQMDIGIFEIYKLVGSQEALKKIGYTMKDISGDGIPELIIGSIAENTDEQVQGTSIYSIYTISDDAPFYTLEGFSRSAYIMMNDGKFLYHGSSGAMHSSFGIFSLSKDGKTLNCEDFYFTTDKDNSSEMEFYQNTTGKDDKSSSTKLDITTDEFWKKFDDLYKKTTIIELKPFEQYQLSNK